MPYELSWREEIGLDSMGVPMTAKHRDDKSEGKPIAKPARDIKV